MAFRASERFPDTQVASRIYAAGGEWHGYTWIDQTTYFETVRPKDLPLVLAIQADRMARLLLPAAELEAERGAVLNELHGYENDPASRLHDAVAAASFAEHPYRHNVIGWTSDVERITHADVAAFYRRHYAPSNAVLAVAGDVRASRVLALVRRAFAGLPAGEPTPPPRTVEPPQLGERRVELQGGGTKRRFQIAYRAPAASDPDFPAFLLLQALLTGSAGCNFRQDGDGVEARPGSLLDGIGTGTVSFLSPTAHPYLFSLAGAASPETPMADIEKWIEERIAGLRERPVPAGELEKARRDLLLELELDAETTEDAAHQMAFFEGIGAFDALRRLPGRVAAVTPEDLRRVAAVWLQPWQRTLGWVHAGVSRVAPAAPPVLAAEAPSPASSPSPPAPLRTGPKIRALSNGVTLVAQRIPRVPAGFLRVVLPGDSLTIAGTAARVAAGEPAWRHTSVGLRFRAGELAGALAEARRALALARPEPYPEADGIDGPEPRLERALRDLLGIEPTAAPALTPVIVAAAGDLDEDEALREMEAVFAGLPARSPLPVVLPRLRKTEERIARPGQAQSWMGYAVPAPAASDPASLAWRILLYIASHGYEGRLGKELIARRGLLYSLDSRYHTDGRAGWISLAAGVDPGRLDETRRRMDSLLRELHESPPTEAEIEEAKEHLVGRRTTEPMSCEEITAAYARDWIEQGRLLPDEEWERAVRQVTRDDVLQAVGRFLRGAGAFVDARSSIN